MDLNDFSSASNPYDETELQARLKALLSQGLRHPSGGANTRWTDLFGGIGQDIQNSAMQRDLEQRTQAQRATERQSLMSAVSGYPDEVQRLFMNTATRPHALALMKQIDEDKADTAYMAARGGGGSRGGAAPMEPVQLGEEGRNAPSGGGFSIGGGAQPSFEDLVYAAGQRNPRRAAQAKLELEHRPDFRPNLNPDMFQPNLSTGVAGPLPGAMEFLAEKAKREAEAKAYGDVQEVGIPGDPMNKKFVSKASLLGLDNRPPVPSPLAGALTVENRPSGAATTPSSPPSSPPSDVPLPADVMARIQAADAARGGQPYVGEVPPGGPAVTRALPQAVAASGGYTTRSEAGKTLDTHLAGELPTLENTHYLARGMLERLPELKQAVKDSPGWLLGRLPLEVARTANSMDLVDDKEMKALQVMNASESALVGPVAAAVGQKLNQGFTDKDLEFLRGQLPSSRKSQAENEQGIKNIETFLREAEASTGQRIRQFNPSWRPVPGRGAFTNPTEPGAVGSAVPGKRSSAADAEGLPEGYWSMTAAGSPSVMSDARYEAPPDTPAPIDEGNFLERGLKGIERGIGMGGVGVTGALPSSVAKLLNLTQPAPEDVRLLRKEGPQTTSGRGGEMFGEAAANPATYVPGSTLPRAIASGALSGYTAPAADAKERRGNAAMSTLMGPVGTALANRIPATELSTPAQAAARVGFEDIPLSQAQIAGKTKAWQGEGIAKSQAEALTERELQKVGSTAKKIDSNELEAIKAKASAEYAAMFPPDKAMRMEVTDATKLRNVLQPYEAVINSPEFIKGSPQIKAMYDFARRVEERGVPRAIPADIVQGALQDVARIEHPVIQAKLRNELNSFAKKDMTEAELAAFEKLNTTWGAIRDLGRVRTKEGLIVPSSLKGEGGDFVKQFGVQDPKAYKMGQGERWGTLGAAAGVAASTMGMPGAGYVAMTAAPAIAHGVERGRGALQGALGTSRVLNADPAVKQLIEMLRSGTQLTPRELLEARRQQNAAQ